MQTTLMFTLLATATATMTKWDVSYRDPSVCKLLRLKRAKRDSVYPSSSIKLPPFDPFVSLLSFLL